MYLKLWGQFLTPPPLQSIHPILMDLFILLLLRTKNESKIKNENEKKFILMHKMVMQNIFPVVIR